jgi:hypothetical protein
MADITPNVVISMPSQLFTLARSFKAAANGRIYIGKIDTDPTIPDNQIQVYIQNEDGTVVPVSQPIMINAGGYPVYGGQISKFVTVEGHSMAIYDSYGTQQFYFSNVLKYDPDQLKAQLAGPDGVLLVGNATDKRDLAGDDATKKIVDHVHVFNDVTVSFRQFLTVKDGSVDASAAITAALNSGFKVEVPGDYVLRVDSPSIVANVACQFFGAPGTRPTILINHVATGQTQFKFMLNNSYFANFNIRYPLQKTTLATGESPIAYGELFGGNGFYNTFENMDIGNCYYGFKFGDSSFSSSRITIRNITGSPILRGMSLDRVLDIPRVSDIHFNYNNLEAPYTYDLTMKQWIHDHLDGFHIGRCDFGSFNRLFVFGALNGIFLRTERFTGSANAVSFTDCYADITVHPLRFQNWQTSITMIGGKFTGNAESTGGLVEKEPSTNLMTNSPAAGNNPLGIVKLIGGEYSNYSSDVFQGSAKIEAFGTQLYQYGKDNGQRAAFNITTGFSQDITAIGCIINGAGGTQNRAFNSSGGTGVLRIGDGTVLSNNALGSFDWRSGPVIPSSSAVLGNPGHNGVSFVSNIPKEYMAESIPTSGSFYLPGDYVTKTNPVKTGFVGQPNYVIQGWRRLTAGSGHVLNTDWVEDRTYFNGVS